MAPLHAEQTSTYPPDTVVATRGGASVTLADVDAALLGATPGQRAGIMNSPRRIDELVNRLLINRQLATEAKGQKIDQDPTVRRAIEQSSERILAEQRLVALRQSADVGDVEALARERYKVNPQAYALPGATSVRHILISTEKHADADAEKIADEVHAKAIAGEDFIGLVEHYSEDESKNHNAGLIIDAESDRVDPAFGEAVRALSAPSQISPVVKSQFGYHVIQFIQRMPPRQRSFDEVKERAMADLRDSLLSQRAQDHVDQLKNEPLDANPDVVASLRTRYMLPTEPAAAGDAKP